MCVQFSNPVSTRHLHQTLLHRPKQADQQLLGVSFFYVATMELSDASKGKDGEIVTYERCQVASWISSRLHQGERGLLRGSDQSTPGRVARVHRATGSQELGGRIPPHRGVCACRREVEHFECPFILGTSLYEMSRFAKRYSTIFFLPSCSKHCYSNLRRCATRTACERTRVFVVVACS